MPFQNDASSQPIQASLPNRAVFFLLLLIPIFSVIAYGAVDTWALTLLAIFIALLALSWFADVWKTKEFVYHASPLQFPLLGIVLLGCIQLLPIGGSPLSLDPYATRFFVIRAVIYLLFFSAALTFINSRSRFRITALTIIIFGSVMAFFAIIQRFASPDAIYGLRAPAQAIPFGTFVNQHHFAAFMVMTGGVVFGLLFGKAKTRDKKPLLLIAALLVGTAVVLTGSRAGLLSLIGVVVFAIFFNVLLGNFTGGKKERRRQIKLLSAGTAALFLIIIGIVIFLGSSEALFRGTGLSTTLQQDVSSGRSHFWSVALQIFFDHPIFGAGLDAFGVAFTRYDTWNGTYRVEQAHNDYLQILSDAGIVGFACVAAFIFLLFRKSFQLIRTARDEFNRSVSAGALAGCFGILIHSFFDFPLRTPSNAFFFLLLVVLAIRALNCRSPHEVGAN